MKLKYYLRGAGIGIIFATLVMTVSSMAHKNNITDEYIIKEAQKLGMVMKDELKGNGGLFGGDETDSETESETTQESESSVETEKPDASEKPSESEKPSTPTTPVESETPVSSENTTKEYVTIVIESGDYARQVAEKVCAAGLVSNAEDFRKYIGQRGYGKSMHPGTYRVPVGSSYEEICLILIKRPT